MSNRTRTSDEDEVTIDLLELAKVLWHRAWLIVLIGILAAGVALVGTAVLITPQYTATVTLYVNNYNNTDSSTSISSGDLTASAKLVDTYIAIIKSNTLLSEVASNAGVSYTTEELYGMLSASSVDSTEVFNVNVTCDSPAEAADIANAIAEVAPSHIAEIVEGSSVKVIDRAKVPTKRSSPSYTKNAALGLLAGIVLMAALIVIRELMDTRIKSEEDLKEWDLPILGVIPDLSTAGKAGGYGYGYGGKG